MANQVENENHLSTDQEAAKNKWQNRLLPWLIIMPTLLILLFVYLATRQMEKFNVVLEEKPTSILKEDEFAEMSANLQDNMTYIRWITLVKMEENSYNRRYAQGGALLASRIFTKYLGFFTGMILAIVGSVFIIGKLQEQTTEIEGEVSAQIKGKLSSSSPGIIFGVLGTVLMLSTILQHNEIEVKDQPLYLTPSNIYINAAGDTTQTAMPQPKQTIDPSIIQSP